MQRLLKMACFTMRQRYFLKHLLALAIVSAFAFGLSYLLLIITDKIIPLRVDEEAERLGLDISQHDESIAE